MAKWRIGDGDHQLVIETTDDGTIRLAIPSGEPIVADVDQAEDIRAALGAAIGTARGGTP